MILNCETDGHDSPEKVQSDTVDSLHAPGVLTPTRYAKYLSIASSIMSDPDEARDAVQNSLRKALEHEHTFERRAQFQSWVIAIIINECLMRRRHSGLWRTMPIDETGESACVCSSRDNPERELARKEVYQLLRREAYLIPKVYREVVILRDFEGRRLGEIGSELGLSVSNVKSRLFRGRIELRNRLERYGLTAHLLASSPAMI